MEIFYHREDNTAPLDDGLKVLFGHAAQIFEGIAAGQRAVRVDDTQGLFGGDVSLEVAGHGKAHGAETKLGRKSCISSLELL